MIENIEEKIKFAERTIERVKNLENGVLNMEKLGSEIKNDAIKLKVYTKMWNKCEIVEIELALGQTKS